MSKFNLMSENVQRAKGCNCRTPEYLNIVLMPSFQRRRMTINHNVSVSLVPKATLTLGWTWIHLHYCINTVTAVQTVNASSHAARKFWLVSSSFQNPMTSTSAELDTFSLRMNVHFSVCCWLVYRPPVCSTQSWQRFIKISHITVYKPLFCILNKSVITQQHKDHHSTHSERPDVHSINVSMRTINKYLYTYNLIRKGSVIYIIVYNTVYLKACFIGMRCQHVYNFT